MLLGRSPAGRVHMLLAGWRLVVIAKFIDISALAVMAINATAYKAPCLLTLCS